MERKTDVFDLLTAEVNRKVDQLGYDLLKSRGYDVAKAHKSKKKMRRLKKTLRRRGESLCYQAMVDRDTGSILVWFEIVDRKNGERLARSQGIKIVQRTGDEV